MNIFVIGWTPSGNTELAPAGAAVSSVVDELGFIDPDTINHWRSPGGHVAVAAASHSENEARTSYAHFEPTRMALFAGRPIQLGADGEPDGRGPLDPRYYLAPAEQWTRTLSGRCTVVRYDEAGTLVIFTDHLGSYPVYSAEANGTRWFSNRPAVLERVVGGRDLNRHALASFLTCGFGLGGTTLWEGIDRLPRGSIHRFGPGPPTDTTPLLPTESIASYVGAGFDRDAAAQALIGTVRAMADWPGRRVRVGLSGGRDSRLVFAAAVAAGIDFEAVTFAFPNTPDFPDTKDVVLARRVAGACGLGLTIEVPPLGGGVRRTARILRLVSNGLVSVAATGLLSLPEPGTPLPLVLSGQAGEIARAYYTSHETSAQKLAEFLFRRMVPAVPRRIVTREAEQTVRDYISSWVNEHLQSGVTPASIPDVFYVLERSRSWAAPTHAVYECVSDVASPLWTPALLPHELGLPQREREQEHFHLRLLEALAPELARIPFDTVNPPWPGLHAARSRRTHHYREVAYKVRRELRRRAQARRSGDATAGDPFLADAVTEAREWTHALPQHPAWDVLDRKRALRLLARKPATLDPRSLRQLMLMVSIFAAENETTVRD